LDKGNDFQKYEDASKEVRYLGVHVYQHSLRLWFPSSDSNYSPVISVASLCGTERLHVKPDMTASSESASDEQLG